MRYNAKDLLENKANNLQEKVMAYELGHAKAPSKKTATGYMRTMDFLYNLADNLSDSLEVDVHPNSNLGEIIEAVFTGYILDEVGTKADSKTADLIFKNGKRYEIKFMIKGSSSLPSTLDLEAKEDVLVISNTGAFVIKRENVKVLQERNLLKPKENKIKLAVLNHADLLHETPLTKRLNKELELVTYE